MLSYLAYHSHFCTMVYDIIRGKYSFLRGSDWLVCKCLALGPGISSKPQALSGLKISMPQAKINEILGGRELLA